MNRLQNTNEIEVTIKTFYKEQIIKLENGKKSFKHLLIFMMVSIKHI